MVNSLDPNHTPHSMASDLGLQVYVCSGQLVPVLSFSTVFMLQIDTFTRSMTLQFFIYIMT